MAKCFERLQYLVEVLGADLALEEICRAMTDDEMLSNLDWVYRCYGIVFPDDEISSEEWNQLQAVTHDMDPDFAL